MFDRTTLTAMLLFALLSVAATCENSAQSPLVLSPQDGQLLRDADSFFVEIEASDKDFDLSTLEVNSMAMPWMWFWATQPIGRSSVQGSP